MASNTSKGSLRKPSMSLKPLKPSKLSDCKFDPDHAAHELATDQLQFFKHLFPSVSLYGELQSTLAQSSDAAHHPKKVFKQSDLFHPDFNRAAESLPHMHLQSSSAMNNIPVSNPNYSRPNSVHFPRYQYFPPPNFNQNSPEYCCDQYSQRPLHILIKAVIIQVHHLVTGLSWPCIEFFEEIHKNFHESIEAMELILKNMQLTEFFNIIAITMPDEKISDMTIRNCLNPEQMSFVTVSGEYRLSEEQIRNVFKLPSKPEQSQYSKYQPITPYFIDFVSINTARTAAGTLKIQEVETRDDIFQLQTSVIENRAFLPLIFLLSMNYGCPYAGEITPSVWIMKKEVLFMIAAAFGVLEFDYAELIFHCLQEDMQRFAEQKTLFCLPLWRALFVAEPPDDSNLRISHIPRGGSTFVDVKRYAEIVAHTVGIELQGDDEINRHYARIMNTYYCKKNEVPTTTEISTILMFEINPNLAGRFKPKPRQAMQRLIMIAGSGFDC